MPELKQLVEDLHKTWESELKPRIDQMETEASKSGEAFAETKQAVDLVQDRLDQVEGQLQKAAFATPENQKTEAVKHFLDFLRKGEDGAPEAVKALSISDEGAGGILSPAEFINEVIKGVVQFSPIRQIAKVRKTSRTSIQFPKRTGLLAASWTSEKGTRSESTNPSYGLEEIPTHELYARILVSNWDLEDAVVDLEQFVRDDMAEQFGVAEGTGFVSGDANGKPEGFLTNSDVIASPILNGGASFANADGVIKLGFSVKEQYWPNASYVMNRLTVRDLRLLKDTTNNYLWQPGVAGGAGVAEGIPPTINGFPYVIATDMPTAASNALTVAFGDFSKGYVVVDRIEIAVLRDPYTAANAGQVVLHARKRVGGQVVLPEALNVLKMA